ncbi:MAG: LPXTG cell wall anchor domain-containing protein [Lachnospiraceae bacterium]|nr:LPXTG cell wall anchor domain-containing protein [Lachnospiraceae bacterium]
MRNSAVKRIIAVLLCLVVFAGSELTGLTNIVGDLFAEESTTGTDDGDRENVVEDVEVEEASEEPQEEPEEVTEEQPEETSEPQEEETVSEESEEIQEPQEIVTDVEDDVTEEDNNESDPEPAETEDNSESGEPADDPEKKTDAEEEKTEENTAAEEADKTQTDASVTDDTKLPTDEEQTIAPETVTDPTEEDQKEKKEDEEEPEAFNEEYQDGQVIIRVEADPGVVPNGTELSVKKIVQQDLEALDDEEEIKEAEELNAKYEGIKSELELTVADDDTKEIAGFVAYDVNFLLTDEDGETAKIEPDGEVSVSMEFEEAYLPEEVAEKEDQIDIESIDVIHMEEAEDDEESETGLKSEVVADADVSTTENAVEKAEFTTDSGRTFVITWTENDLGEREYICETEDAVIKVTAAKGVVPDGALLKVVPILADHQETQKQYQDVEKKLLEKAETEKYEIAGFLAYDISFTDETGAKLEPTGEVKVAIDYKKAAIPEDLKDLASTTYALDDAEDTAKDDAEQAESAKEEPEQTAEASKKEDGTTESSASQSEASASAGSITVMHLEENEQGQVTKVVDMGAEGKVTELISTKDQKVTSTEFVTESFSTFTIVWMNGSVKTELEISCYDLKGNLLELAPESEELKRLTLKRGDTFNIANIVSKEEGPEKAYCRIKVKDQEESLYIFDGEASFYINGIPGIKIKALTCDGNGIFLISELGESIPLMPGMEMRFIYHKSVSGPVTVDNDDFGITMRMIDYGSNSFEQGKQIQEDYLGEAGKWIGGDLTQGVVKNRLENGYPVAESKNMNLGPLFGERSDESVNPQEVNHLFRQDIYEGTGYFEYSSFENYAYLEKDNNFTLYDGIGTPGEHNQKPDEPALFYKRGNFLPYNKVEEGVYSTQYRNLYDENGNPLKESDDRFNAPLYDPLEEEINYSFGMYMEAAFSQPTGGKVEAPDGKMSDMIYRFNGDDDLWLFIDDTLILDIGGSHDARSGTINFSTGVVRIEEDGIAPTTIKELFRNAGFFPDGTSWNNEDVDKYFEGNTFADYSTHRIKMFYMERGGAASNLKISMNLSTIPKGTIEVEKQLSNTDKEKYKEVKFAFQVFAQKIASSGTDKAAETYVEGEYVTLSEAVDKATDAPIKFQNVTIDGTTYENVFYLTPGQAAQFQNLQDDRKYYVKEIGVKSSEYDKVTITGSTVENHDNQGGTTTSSDIQSAKKTVGERPRVVYINECSAQNSRKLRITKQMMSGQSSDGTFTFKVFLGDQPFDGQYDLIKSDKTRQENLQASPEGVISGVSVGDTVEIDQIMSDTTFKVEEVIPEEEDYEYTLVGITGAEGTYGKIDNTSSDSKVLEGKILLGKDAEVTVTNALKNVQSSGLSITKKLKEGSSGTEDSFEFNVFQILDGKLEAYSGEYSVGSETKSATNGKISLKAGETALLEMTAGTKFKVEETLSEGYGTPEITVTESTATEPKVEGNTVEGVVVEGQYAGITVTNVPAYSYDWQIVKRGTTDNSKPLEDAEFTLTSKPSQGEAKVYYGRSQKDSGVLQWYKEDEVINISDIDPGEYELEETKAPTGYMRSNEKWKITLAYGSITVKDSSGEIRVTPTTENGRQKYEYTFLNEAVYELPSTGGAGIFGYMISGVLLMMAGVLVLYKRKYAGRC